MAYVFIGHNHKDGALARRIADDLAEAEIAVWLDEGEILIGDSITQRVQEGLNQVDFVVLLFTKNSVDSGWMEKEWQSQIGIEAERKQIRLLPVRADSCEIPLLLRDKKCADLSNDYGHGLSELVWSIHGHAGRQTANLPQPPSRYLGPKKATKLVYRLAALVALGLMALTTFTAHRIRVGSSKSAPSDSNKSALFPNRPHIVPPAESYRIREVLQPPVPNYSQFELLEDRRVIDLRDWKPFDRGAAQRISPVTWSRTVKLRKRRASSQIRFSFGTEGAGIDAVCSSGQDYYLETGTMSCEPPQVLLKTLQVVVNVEKYKVGEEFQIELQATFWNGSFDQEDWTAYKVYAPVKKVSMLLLFPEQKAFKWKKLVMYKPDSSRELSPPENQLGAIYNPNSRELFWEIREPIVNNIYEIQWGW